MALQSSGAISLANVQTEFGGSNPIGINEYYGVAAGVPGSGTISLYDFYGKGVASGFAGWTYLILGYSYFMSASVGSNSLTGNTITPGSGNSPRTFEIGQVKGGAGYSPPPYPTMTLQYYQGGSLNTTWTFTSSYAVDYQIVSFTATFGSSSIRFDSSITDPNNYDDIDGYNYINTPYSGPQTTVFNHGVNLSGGGQYDVDYDD